MDDVTPPHRRRSSTYAGTRLCGGSTDLSPVGFLRRIANDGEPGPYWLGSFGEDVGRVVAEYTLICCVTTMLDAAVDLCDIQIATRHADPRTTMRYDRTSTTIHDLTTPVDEVDEPVLEEVPADLVVEEELAEPVVEEEFDDEPDLYRRPGRF